MTAALGCGSCVAYSQARQLLPGGSWPEFRALPRLQAAFGTKLRWVPAIHQCANLIPGFRIRSLKEAPWVVTGTVVFFTKTIPFSFNTNIVAAW